MSKNGKKVFKWKGVKAACFRFCMAVQLRLAIKNFLALLVSLYNM